jgi:formylglycine-generating enzyme required for sulfatase activity
MRKLLILSLLALSYQSASATSLLESFGSGANAFTMEFVTIGNPGNVADTTGNPYPVGAVGYIYNIGKYEVSRDQVDKANSQGNLGIRLADMTNYGGNGLLKPATGITWYEAAKFVNWLNTSSGSAVAYKFDGSGSFQLWSSTDTGYNANNLFRNSLAKYWLPSIDEWHKGAYGNPNGNWSNFPNGSDSAPTPVASGTDPNTAVYAQSYDAGPADINNAGGLSAYGTMGQGGNVMEWIETANDGSNDSADELPRKLRSGAWPYDDFLLNASSSYHYGASSMYDFVGFRVASVPEPSALSLLAIGLGGLAMMRRRRS